MWCFSIQSSTQTNHIDDLCSTHWNHKSWLPSNYHIIMVWHTFLHSQQLFWSLRILFLLQQLIVTKILNGTTSILVNVVTGYHRRIWRIHEDNYSHSCRSPKNSYRTDGQQISSPNEWFLQMVNLYRALRNIQCIFH